MAFWYTVWMSSSRITAVRVLRLRVKDKHAGWLCGLAREVNTVFNYCNELSVKVFERERRFLSGFDFWPFLKGVTRGECALHLPIQAVQEIAEEYARRRRQHQKIRLAWRKSHPLSAQLPDTVFIDMPFIRVHEASACFGCVRIPSNSSSVLPLVSGASITMNRRPAAATNPYARNVPAGPQVASSMGKSRVTLALTSEFQNPTTEIAAARSSFGNISDRSTHITGPREIAKEAT